MSTIETIIVVVGAASLTVAIIMRLALWSAKREVAHAKVIPIRNDKSIATEIVDLMAKDGFLHPAIGERPVSYLPKLLHYIKWLRSKSHE